MRENLLSEALAVREVINEELVRIGSYNERLNAFITIFNQDSFPIEGQLEILENFRKRLSLRKESTKDILGNGATRLPLYGIPFVIKDNIFFSQYRATAGSGTFQDFVPEANADIVDAFLRAGAVPLGKTNLHELGMGATSSSSFFGPVRNPMDESRISGGSSGGSAVAVSMSVRPIVGIGTDTGGSVRIPAALCGVCGFKPTFGTLSTSGVFPLSATLDHVGILTKTMEDMVTAFRAITLQNIFQNTKPSRNRKMRIGIPRQEYFFEDCDKQVYRAFWNAIKKMSRSGQFEVDQNIEIPDFSRISRIRRSIQIKEAGWFYEELVTKPEKRKLLRPDVLTFLDAGTKTGMMEYMVSSVERLHLITKMAEVFKAVDFLALPTCLTLAPSLDDVLGKEAGAIRSKLVRNTELFNLCGFPSLSIPTHRINSSVLPAAIQLSGPHESDMELLTVGQQIWNILHSQSGSHSKDPF